MVKIFFVFYIHLQNGLPNVLIIGDERVKHLQLDGSRINYQKSITLRTITTKDLIRLMDQRLNSWPDYVVVMGFIHDNLVKQEIKVIYKAILFVKLN